MELENGVVPELPDYEAEITAIVKSTATPRLKREKLAEYHGNDIAQVMSGLTHEERIKLYSVFDLDTLADVFEYFDEPTEYLDELNITKRAQILARTDTTVCLEYLKGHTKGEREAVAALLPEEVREEIKLLFSFDEDEIGSKMVTNFISVTEGVDVRGAMSELVKQAADNDNVSTVYVTDAEGVFVGAIDLKDLIRARSNDPLENIIMTSYPYVYAEEKIEECIERILGYSEDSVPVLDAEGRLIGVLTAQDLSELATESIADDYAKLGGLSSEEDLKEPLIRSIAKRLPWLVILFALGLVVSGVVGLFDSVVDSLPFIVAFQSLILGMAGNVGTQSLAVTVRALSDEALSTREKLSLVFKETRVGLFNGFILGAISVLLVGLFLSLRGTEPHLAFSVGLCTGMALLLSMVLSGLSGSVIPIVLKRFKIDPAAASGPFITTINDLVAVVTYYGLAGLLLLQL